MKSYTHFTLDERICLQKLFSEGLSMRKIASILGRSPSTISREIKRNWSKKKKHYHAWGANVKYICRRKNSHRKNRLLTDSEMYRFTHEALLKYWSPEIIAGRWNVEHSTRLSFSSINQLLYCVRLKIDVIQIWDIDKSFSNQVYQFGEKIHSHLHL